MSTRRHCLRYPGTASRQRRFVTAFRGCNRPKSGGSFLSPEYVIIPCLHFRCHQSLARRVMLSEPTCGRANYCCGFVVFVVSRQCEGWSSGQERLSRCLFFAKVSSFVLMGGGMKFLRAALDRYLSRRADARRESLRIKEADHARAALESARKIV